MNDFNKKKSGKFFRISFYSVTGSLIAFDYLPENKKKRLAAKYVKIII